jgi:hypothetical protein
MGPLALFSWGYWGWGTSTPQLLQAVDAAEAARGFRPPLFVDIRYSRGVRAPGFRDGAFERRAGPGRYVWMSGLGNRAISTGGMEIANPAAAGELLDLAAESARQGRRVLFFCACEFPRWQGRLNCHRDEVAGLVLKAARRRAVSVNVAEWPGGEPTAADLDVRPGVMRAVLRGRATVPLGSQLPPQFAGLPWGSADLAAGHVTLELGGQLPGGGQVGEAGHALQLAGGVTVLDVPLAQLLLGLLPGRLVGVGVGGPEDGPAKGEGESTTHTRPMGGQQGGPRGWGGWEDFVQRGQRFGPYASQAKHP